MECFLKYIETFEEQAVLGDFEKDHFTPFTLVALSGFHIPPLRAEAGLFVDFMFELASIDQQVALCRNQADRDQQFCTESDRVLSRLKMNTEEGGRPGWRRSTLYQVTQESREPFVKLLRSHWKVWGGNWIFFDWPLDPEAVQAGAYALCQGWEDIHQLRANIFRSRNFVALTFDDNLLDIFVNSPMDEPLELLKAAAERNGIRLCFDEIEGLRKYGRLPHINVGKRYIILSLRYWRDKIKELF